MREYGGFRNQSLDRLWERRHLGISFGLICSWLRQTLSQIAIVNIFVARIFVGDFWIEDQVDHTQDQMNQVRIR